MGWSDLCFPDPLHPLPPSPLAYTAAKEPVSRAGTGPTWQLLVMPLLTSPLAAGQSCWTLEKVLMCECLQHALPLT